MSWERFGEIAAIAVAEYAERRRREEGDEDSADTIQTR